MTAALPIADRVASRIRYRQARQDLQRDLERALAGAPPQHRTGPVVGFATLSSGPWHLGLELLLGQSLQLRGARPELLLCDVPDLPACDERSITSRSRERCEGCLSDKQHLLDAGGLRWRAASTLLRPDALSLATRAVAALDPRQLSEHLERGWPIGEWVYVSACHYLRRDARGLEPEQIDAWRRYLITAIVMVEVIENWLDDLRPDIVIAESGAHVMWRVARELARARNIPVVCREMGKGGWDQHLYALNGDSMSPDLAAPWADARSRPLTVDEEAAVDRLIDELPARTYMPQTHNRSVSLPRHPRTVTAFPNVTWDLATAGRDVAFTGVFDWLRETIRIVEHLPGVRLIVRAHPAEATVTTRERVIDQVAAEWPALPANVTLIAPGEAISARELCEQSDLVLVYNSTAGLEAASRGRAVAVCGAPHFRGKGFTIDIGTRPDYAAFLRDWAAGAEAAPPANAIALARRYAHLFFLRYHIAMGWTTSPLEPPFALRLKSWRELMPGANPALDVVCAGILEARQVVLPRALDPGHRT